MLWEITDEGSTATHSKAKNQLDRLDPTSKANKDDQYKNPNMNNKDHQVVQLTNFNYMHQQFGFARLCVVRCKTPLENQPEMVKMVNLHLSLAY